MNVSVLRELVYSFLPSEDIFYVKKDWEKIEATYCIEKGYVDLFKWFVSRGEFPQTVHLESAAKLGHIKLFKQIELHFPGYLSRLKQEICGNAMQNGHLRLMKFAASKHCILDAYTVRCVVMRGCLRTVKWLEKHKCNWNESVTELAAQFQHFQILKFLIKKGCPFDADCVCATARSGPLKMFKWLLKQKNCSVNPLVGVNVALRCNLKMIKHFHARCPQYLTFNDVIFCATMGKNAKMLKWALSFK